MKLLPQFLGIVGSEAAKFTPRTEKLARQVIRNYLKSGEWAGVASGQCHLGGIDIWAIEEAEDLGLLTEEFPPRKQSWSDGYKPRNIQIAERSAKVICITVKNLPPDYKGTRYTYCYHCKTHDHIKSGGCWTVHYAKLLGKPGEVIVVE